jgi:hypothetical protein
MLSRTECPSCELSFEYEKFSAGFGDQGFVYGSSAAIVLTWSAFDPAYVAIVDAHPWMLSLDQQQAVEAALKPDLPGGPFRFANAPLCPKCKQPLRDLADESREYFVITGDRVDSERTSIWSA